MPNQFYRTPDPYERVNINQLARINQNDPWFGLGYALAQGWNRAYNQRGVEKSVDELEKSLSPTEQERSNARDAVLSTQPTVEEDYNQLNQYLDDTLKNGGGYVANPATANAFDNAQAPDGSLFAAAQNWSNNSNNQPMYSFGVGDARAYKTGNAQAIDALANAQAADRLRKFDIDSWQAQQRANLVKQGRSPEQIEAAMAVMMPQAQALDERNKDLDTQDALAMLGNLDLSAGYNPQAYQLIGRLSKSNPELAKMLTRDIISPRDEYEVGAQLAAQDNSFNNSVKLAQARDQIGRNRQVWENNYTVEQLKKMGWNDRDIATYMAGGSRGSSGSKTGTRSLIGSKDFEFAQQQLEALKQEAEILAEQGKQLSPEQQAQFNQYSNYINNAINQTYGGYGSYVPAQQGGNDFISATNKALQSGATTQQILDNLRSKGYTESDPEYQQVAQYLSQINLPSQQAPAQQQQPAPQENSNWNFDFSWLNPQSPMLQPDADGNPHWVNVLNQQGIIGFGNTLNQMNQGANGMPYWNNK